MPRPNVSGERKPQILKAAMKVFNRRGIAATRMEDIAREADLSVGGVYWYYKGKDDVILAIMDELINTDVAALTSLLAAPGTLRERLTEYMCATARWRIAAHWRWLQRAWLRLRRRWPCFVPGRPAPGRARRWPAPAPA